MSMLSISEVSKYYGDFQALQSVSLEIEKRSIFGLLGPNGAGKTSLIRIINQITAPDSGFIELNGERLKPEHIAKIGYLPEERGLYPKMKVGEQLLYLARLKDLDKKTASKRINEWLDRFNIADWRNKNLEELSKGMAQKIQFVATVLHEPELLIFDEPFTGFDPINTNLIKSEIKRLRDQGSTIIFSTHRMESVEEICDHIALINKSQKILEGPLKQVKKQHASNTFSLELEGAYKAEKHSTFTVENHTSHHETSQLIVKLNGSDSNDILKEITSTYRVLSFQEQMPSLNDIFIQKVQGS
jgi:ABC-2 type transport system ATP-binding protein